MDGLHPGSRELVLSRLQPDVRHLFETGARTTWIPLEQDAVFVDAIVAGLGGDLSGELWTAYTARFVQTPLQRTFFDGAIRLFGMSVGTFVRIIPRIWTTCYRGAGELDATEVGPDWRKLQINDMHPAMCEREGYLILLRSMFRGMYQLANCDSEDFDMTFDPSARVLAVEFRWPN